MSNPPLLSIQSLCCERGYRPLFSNLAFDVAATDIIRIAGPNGAGKSTLLNVLAGISSDYEGKILFKGEPLSRVTFEYRQQLCYLGHAKAVKNQLTPTENLQWFCSMYPTRENTRIGDVLEKVGLKLFSEQLCGQLSAGQKQRVALARLLISSAQLWIIDEPFTAIDQEGVKQFEKIIADFAAAGGAVLITTHHDLQISGNYRSIDVSARGVE